MTAELDKTLGDRLARLAVIQALRRVRAGRIEVVEDGRRQGFGPPDAKLQATLTIRDPAAWRGPLRGSLGLGETYVAGLWEADDLVSLIRIAARELRQLDGLRGAVARPRGLLHRLRRLVPENTRSGAREHIAAHYDLGNDLFSAFLDGQMVYSCAYFPDEDASLEEAQLAKLERICDRLRLGPDNHLLEIGAGWGGLAIHAARERGCRVTTTTISAAQRALATRRVREAGLEDRVTVLERDYRDLDGRYDRLASVEMIEAVGWQYFDDFFRRCAELLAPDGLMLLQAITIDDGIYETEKGVRSFANTHVFPGGCLPSQRMIANCLPRHRPARGLAGGHHRPLPAHARRLAREIPRRLGAAARARLRRALPPTVDLLPEQLGGRLPRAPDRRRAGAACEAGVLGEFPYASNRKERRLIVERTENPQWLSNAYLVADEPGGKGVLIDGNDELGPLLERADREGIEVTHVLLTHAHPDHVAGLAEARERLGGPPLVAHPELTTEIGEAIPVTLADGAKLSTGGLEIEAISTPGHAAGHIALLVNGSDVFTADVLFKGTVGGTMAPGASGFADLQSSVMRLMELPPETTVHPGHREPTTIGEEWESNPFVRIWRGLEEPGAEDVTVWGRPATLKLWAPDYDGGNKAWIVFGDSGEEAIVGGSQVERG